MLAKLPIVLQTIDYLAPAFSCCKLSLYQPLKIHSDSVDKILQLNVSFFGLTDCTPDRDNKRVMGTGAKKGHEPGLTQPMSMVQSATYT